MDTRNNEIKPLSYSVPYALDITLYKHNYYDNLIITHLKKSTRYESIIGEMNSFIVTVEEFKEVLENKFKDVLDSVQNLNDVSIREGVNSIYFIDKLFSNFTNLEFVKINVSNERSFSRLLEIDKNRRVISFEYRIVTGILDISKYVESDEELLIINDLFKEMNLLVEDEFGKKNNYFTITSQDFLTLIGSKSDLLYDEDTDYTYSGNEKYTEVIDLLYDLIDSKCEADNTRLIVITDYI